MNRGCLGLVIVLIAANSLAAQQLSIPPIRQLSRIDARVPDSLRFGGIGQIVALSDGQLLINDVGSDRLILVDSMLHTWRILTNPNANDPSQAYGSEGGVAVAYRADTTVFLDARSQSLLVIDPSGRLTRVIAFPRPSDAAMLGDEGYIFAAGFYPVIDTRGRIVYALTSSRASLGDPTTQDSDAVIRVGIATRAVDTVGFVRRDKTPARVPTVDSTGVTYPRPVAQPFRRHDAWAAWPDGTVAFVRAQDYHLDWVNADGAITAAPRVAHDWHRLTDDIKTAIIDSLREYYRANPVHLTVTTPAGRAPRDVQPIMPEPSAIPDYAPVFRLPPLVDWEGNLWIPTSSPSALPPGPALSASLVVYDVVDRGGVLIDRVALPGGTQLVGFGHGVAFLSSREGPNAYSLARIRVH